MGRTQRQVKGQDLEMVNRQEYEIGEWAGIRDLQVNGQEIELGEWAGNRDR